MDWAEKNVTTGYNLAFSLETLKISLEPIQSSDLKAVAAMKGPPHPDFLGQKSETHQAFGKMMKPQQCCYACQGMMGYTVAVKLGYGNILQKPGDGIRQEMLGRRE